MSSDNDSLAVKVVGAIIFCIVWFVVAINIDDARAPRTAETLGFTDVRVEDSTIWFPGLQGCGVWDVKLWHVSGVDSAGTRRNFIVCGGVFKGNTLRVK